MKKKKPEHYWNYRVVTKLNTYEARYDLDGEGVIQHSIVSHRTFYIAEVHYENDKPHSIADKYILNSDTLSGLRWSNKKIQRAFKKPVLDLDNNFKKWKKKKLTN